MAADRSQDGQVPLFRAEFLPWDASEDTRSIELPRARAVPVDGCGVRVIIDSENADLPFDWLELDASPSQAAALAAEIIGAVLSLRRARS